MLIFYRDSSSNFTKWVESKLEEMVVAHKIIQVDDNSPLPGNVKKNDLPVLSDGHEEWKTKKQIKEFLEDFHQDLTLSRNLQSDTCHIDPENPGECL